MKYLSSRCKENPLRIVPSFMAVHAISYNSFAFTLVMIYQNVINHWFPPSPRVPQAWQNPEYFEWYLHNPYHCHDAINIVDQRDVL